MLKNIKSKHPLYPKATDGRGVAHERIGNWDKAEKDLLASLSADPDQAYVINYLAYSWIEKGIKIEKSLNMLEKANKLKSNDPFIIDSLGWVLFKKVDFSTGNLAYEVEQEILTWLRVELGLGIYLIAEQMPQGGHTETVDASEIDLPTIWAKIEQLTRVKR